MFAYVYRQRHPRIRGTGGLANASSFGFGARTRLWESPATYDLLRGETVYLSLS